MKNIKYNSKSLSDTYSKIRTSWSEFYDSEKTILERVGISFKDSVLDLGCACGGLGRALKEKFSITDYISVLALWWKRMLSPSYSSFKFLHCVNAA